MISIFQILSIPLTLDFLVSFLSMETIQTKNGDVWGYDPSDKRIYLNGKVVQTASATPLFFNNGYPEFCGIYNRDNNTIITKSGQINKVTNIDSI